MLRQRSSDGWYLIRHPDHAKLAGEFAKHWGNELFRPPEPRDDVIHGIASHDDGWAERDKKPLVTRVGKPSAFGADLVGKYTAFEEIDLQDYLGVRGNALEVVAVRNPYAAILISMHTCNLLTEHADRTTIKPAELPLLDAFIARQRDRQLELRAICGDSGKYSDTDLSAEMLRQHFCLLQACDNLSLLSCVDFDGSASLLHALPTKAGGFQTVAVKRVGPRRFSLDPYPFDEPAMSFSIPARRVIGETFAQVTELQAQYAAAPEETIIVEIVK
jgi:hypothetical protein